MKNPRGWFSETIRGPPPDPLAGRRACGGHRMPPGGLLAQLRHLVLPQPAVHLGLEPPHSRIVRVPLREPVKEGEGVVVLPPDRLPRGQGEQGVRAPTVLPELPLRLLDVRARRVAAGFPLGAEPGDPVRGHRCDLNTRIRVQEPVGKTNGSRECPRGPAAAHFHFRRSLSELVTSAWYIVLMYSSPSRWACSVRLSTPSSGRTGTYPRKNASADVCRQQMFVWRPVIARCVTSCARRTVSRGVS